MIDPSAWTLLTLFAAPLQECVAPDVEDTFERRWGGYVYDVFVRDASEVWTAEDGGRIRHTTDGGQTWTFDSVTVEARDHLRKVHFLDDGLEGWAVSEDGWVLHTSRAAPGDPTSWDTIARVPENPFVPTITGYSSLFDVHFMTPQVGFLVSKHGMWESFDGGQSWSPSRLVADVGGTDVELDDATVAALKLEFYAVDVHQRTGLAVAQPGVVFEVDLRCFPFEWRVVWDLFGTITGECEDLPCLTGSTCPDLACFDPDTSPYEPWDIEISHNEGEPLAIMVGGFGFDCGAVYTSTASSTTCSGAGGGMHFDNWVQEMHECMACDIPAIQQCLPIAQCTTGSSSSCLFPNDITECTPGGCWPLEEFRTLYGVALFSADNSAVAVGYNGQHVWRDTSQTPAVWRDVTKYMNCLPVNSPECTPTWPFYGVDSVESGTEVWSVGAAGQIQHSTTRGRGNLVVQPCGPGTPSDAYLPQADGGPWRSRSIHAVDADTVFWCGQHSRISKSTNGGLDWRAKNELMYQPALESITFDGTGQVGVAVGRDQWPPVAGVYPIFFSTDNGETWSDSTVLGSACGAPVVRNLYDVDWVDRSDPPVFVASGTGAYVLMSDPGFPDVWNRLCPAIPDGGFEAYGVSFWSPLVGVAVGRSGGAAAAWIYDNRSGTPVWHDVSPDPADGVQVLSEVDLLGRSLYAVGRKVVDGEAFGTVLELSSAQLPGARLQEVACLPAIPSCTDPSWCIDMDCRVLNDVEIVDVVDPDTQQVTRRDVWVAGDCGVVWQLVGGETWVQHKSQTDIHIQALSFVDANLGYAITLDGGTCGCEEATSQSVVVAYDPLDAHDPVPDGVPDCSAVIVGPCQNDL